MRFLAIVSVIWLALAAMSARIFRGPIEADLTGKARATLDGLEMPMVVVKFDHLDATLSGNVANSELKVAAVSKKLQLVEQITIEQWVEQAKSLQKGCARD